MLLVVCNVIAPPIEEELQGIVDDPDKYGRIQYSLPHIGGAEDAAAPES